MIYCLINAKFGMKKQNHAQTQVMGQKYQMSKIQDGDRHDFENGFIAISQLKIIRFQ